MKRQIKNVDVGGGNEFYEKERRSAEITKKDIREDNNGYHKKVR